MIHPDDRGEFEAMTAPIDGGYSPSEARIILAVERLTRVLTIVVTRYHADNDD